MDSVTENIRRLLTAHLAQDDDAFWVAAEGIIRELSVGNRLGEARVLKNVLHEKNKYAASLHPQKLQSLNSLRGAESMFVFPKRQVSRSQIFLSAETSESVDTVLLEHHNKSNLSKHGLYPKNKLLFWGPPGCGKTITAQMIAHELNIPFGVVRLSSLITSFVGETAANLHKVFGLAATNPMVLLLDEADALAKNREDPNDVGELKRVVNSLIQAMDEMPLDRSIIIMASNHQYLLDPAIWRRFDDIIYFPIPSEKERLDYLKYLTNGLRMVGSLAQLAKQTARMSFGDLEKIVIESSKEMILKKIDILNASIILSQSRKLKKKRTLAQRASRSE